MTSQGEIDAILAEAEETLGAPPPEYPDSALEEDAAPQPAPPAPRPRPSEGVARRRRNVTRSDVQRILRIEVPVIVRLAHRAMRVREVMQLASGSIIEFDKAADAELDLMINNEIVGYGQAVKVGENFGLRVLRILSLQEKIAALGVGRGKD